MLLIFGFLSCEEHIQPNLPYFPLDSSNEWRYQRWISSGAKGTPAWLMDTSTLIVQNEITIDGKVYREIVDENGFVDKIVRIQGSKYFARNHELYRSDFSHEYVFLDTDKAVGESWSYIKDDNSKTEYVIQARNATRTIGGIEYKNIIEVRVNYFNPTPSGEFEHWVTALHYYAKGVGEIYHYYPYPISLRYGDVSGYIIDSKN
jgi:hypothetical protein